MGFLKAMHLTLGGNATVLIEWGDLRVLTDPWLADRIGPWPRLRPCGLRRAQLSTVSVCLLSHAHPDHFDPAALAGLPAGTPLLCAGEAVLHRLRKTSLAGGAALAPWETWERGPLRVTATPCRHTRCSTGFVIEHREAGERVYFGGDATPRNPFAEITRRCGPLDVALVPVGGSTLAPAFLQRHLTPAQAAAATAQLHPRIAVPIHWGHMACIPAALDRFRGTAAQYAAAMRKLAPEIDVCLPPEGERLLLEPASRG